MIAGWPFAAFRQVTGYDLRHEWSSEIAQLTQREWGRLTSNSFRLTPKGLRFADSAAQLFLRS
jgi:coproporphyrinogen III oxidase-like Fe-S oxidoreductase